MLGIGRRNFITLLGSAAAWPLAARAQERERVRRIGVLMGYGETDPEAQVLLSEFNQGLAELGWRSGRNLRMDIRWAPGNVDQMPSLAKELVGLQPEVILANSTPVTLALQRETQTIPIVFTIVSDPVGSGIVASLPHPGRNITGFSHTEASLASKWLELLMGIVPGLKRAAMMFNPDTAPYVRRYFVPSFEDAARLFGVTFRRPGWPRVRLPGLPGSTEFMQAYQDALGSRPEPVGAKRTKPGSLDAALVSYYGAAEFKGLAKGTQGMRRAILERWRVKNGSKPLNQLPPEYISAMLSRMEPHTARNWLKAIRHFAQYCVAHKLMRHDPTLGLKAKVPQSDGFHTWNEDEIARYEAHYPIGSKARLALALGLYTAQRRGDAVMIGRQHIRECTDVRLQAIGVQNVISVRQSKTGTPLLIPILPELQMILDATINTGQLTLLMTKSGKSYGADDFSAQFRKWCDDARMPPECSFHGLRKAACTRLAEAGCTAHEIAAISGHKSMRLIEHYTRAVDQAKLARAAMERIGKKIVKPEPRQLSKPLKAREKIAT